MHCCGNVPCGSELRAPRRQSCPAHACTTINHNPNAHPLLEAGASTQHWIQKLVARPGFASVNAGRSPVLVCAVLACASWACVGAWSQPSLTAHNGVCGHRPLASGEAQQAAGLVEAAARVRRCGFCACTLPLHIPRAGRPPCSVDSTSHDLMNQRIAATKQDLPNQRVIRVDAERVRGQRWPALTLLLRHPGALACCRHEQGTPCSRRTK